MDEHTYVIKTTKEPDFLFEKRYDALIISPEKTGNNLNGTCQLGQLLMRGYDQELRNGLHLREAYFYDGDKTSDEHAASDSRMRLWDLTQDNNGGRKTSTPVIGDPTKQIYQEPNLRCECAQSLVLLFEAQQLISTFMSIRQIVPMMSSAPLCRDRFFFVGSLSQS